MKKIIAIGCGILLALGILFFSNKVTTVNRGNFNFNYTSKLNREDPVQLTTGEKVEIPFELKIDEGISRLNLELEGFHKNIKGISFSDSTVQVEKGKAQSKLIMQIKSDDDLKAGSHILTIIAKDMDSDTIVSKGEIMINFNMLKVVAGCSC